MSLVLEDGGHASHGVGGLYGCGILLCLLLVKAISPIYRCCRWLEDRGMVSVVLMALALMCFHDGCVVSWRLYGIVLYLLQVTITCPMWQRCRWWEDGFFSAHRLELAAWGSADRKSMGAAIGRRMEAICP